MRAELIGHFQPCMTEIHLHIDARMADYIRTHPYLYLQQPGLARISPSPAATVESVWGTIGGDRRYDTATFHTRLDGLDTSGRLRRTMHQYYARGAWTADGRGPAPPLTDWNVFPERLANSADVCGMIMAP